MTRLTTEHLQSLSKDAEDAASRGLALTVAGARVVDFIADHMELVTEFRRVRRALERAESGTELMELRKALEIIARQNLSKESEIDDDDPRDFILGYDECVKTAREALNPKAQNEQG